MYRLLSTFGLSWYRFCFALRPLFRRRMRFCANYDSLIQAERNLQQRMGK